MTSISGTTTAPLPVPFSLNIRAVSQRVADRESTSQRKDERAKQLATLRKARYEVELRAAEYALILLDRDIFAALDPATDPALAHKIRQAVQNRAVGKVREAEDDEDAKKAKGSGVLNILEVLAAASRVAAAIERTPPSPLPRIERDIGSGGTDEDFEKLMQDIDADDEGEES